MNAAAPRRPAGISESERQHIEAAALATAERIKAEGGGCTPAEAALFARLLKPHSKTGADERSDAA